MTHVFELRSLPPSKKNRRGLSRGRVYDTTKAAQNGILLQIQAQWKRRQTIEHAEVEALFHGPHGNADLDNMLTTMLDLLRAAGVIRNDSAARLGRIEARWEYREEAGALVRVTEVSA